MHGGAGCAIRFASATQRGSGAFRSTVLILDERLMAQRMDDWHECFRHAVLVTSSDGRGLEPASALAQRVGLAKKVAARLATTRRKPSWNSPDGIAFDLARTPSCHID
jgi:hypothetical protein